MNAFALLPPAAFSAPLFDAAQFCVLGELQEEGDAELIAEIVVQFLEDVAFALNRLDQDIAEGRLSEIGMTSHTLKGSFATFGMMRASALALEIESAVQQQRCDNLAYLCREMFGCFLAGKRALQTHMSSRWHVELRFGSRQHAA